MSNLSRDRTMIVSTYSPWCRTLEYARLILIGLAFAAGNAIGFADDAEADRPNFVLIYADDLGYADLSCYGNGYHETPHIDRLMNDGVRFTQAYSNAPLCAPSRIGLLTGRHCARAGCYEVVPGRYLKQVNLDLVEFLPPENKLDLPSEHRILPEYLQEIGYRTGCFGKWHVGPAKPDDRGFDDFVRLWNGSHLDVTKSFQAKSAAYPAPEGYSSDYLMKCAEQFLDSNDDRPFFLYLPHTLIHTAMGPGTTPLEPKPDLLRKYQAKAKTELHRNPAYAAMVEALDQAVGQTIESLRGRELLDNTVVIFTSDNGGLLGGKRTTASGVEAGNFTSNHPLRSGKARLYEGGIRVPTSFSYGRNIRKAAVSNAIVSQLDLLPTILKLANHPQANELADSLDGTSLVPLLNREDASLPDRELFWHYPGYRMDNPKATRREAMTGQRPESAVREGKWKLIESLETGHVQLYDLTTDIGEQENVADSNPTVMKRLRERLHAWRAETGAPMPQRKAEKRVTSGRRVTNDSADTQLIPNSGFEEGDTEPKFWLPTEWRSRWAMVPSDQGHIKQGHGRCLRLEGSGKSPVWRSAIFPLDAKHDHNLSARLRTIGLAGNRAEVYLEALNAEGKVLGTLGKGWPAYRTAAGISATGQQPWRELTITLKRQDVPKGTTQARAVCSVQVAVPGGGYAFFDELACRPAPVTSAFQLVQNAKTQPGNLGMPGEPLSFRIDIDAPQLANQSIDAELEIKGYWGVTVRERAVRINFDGAGSARVEPNLKPFSRNGWYSVRLHDDDHGTLCESAFGMVDPALSTSDIDPISPYGVAELNKQDLEIARRVGINAVRHSVTFNVQWGWIEPKQGQFNDHVLSEAVGKVDRLRDSGIRSGVMIGGWSPKNIPWWAQQPTDRTYNDTHQRKVRPRGNYSLPADLKAWQAYLSHIATAFRGKIDIWEIWNENDLPEFWQGSVEDYLTLLRTSSTAIRAADPHAKIAMCGISTTITGQDHQQWFEKRRDEVRRELDIEFDPRGFLDRVLRDGKNHFDILNFHPYGTLEEIEKGCRIFRDTATKHKCADRPWWITETGVGTHLTGPYRATAREQARRYWQIHAICRAYGADRLFWLSFADLGRDPHYHWDNFGLLNLDRIPKPALLAQASLARHLGNADFVRQIPLGDKVRAFEFDRDGVPLTMVWSDRNQTLRPTLSDASTVRDIMGNHRGSFAADVLAHLKIGPDPVLLIGGRITLESNKN